MTGALLHCAANALRYRLSGARTPLVLSVSVTSRCNLACSYCYSAADNRSSADVPLPELIRLIDEFHALGTRIFMLQGGEPLLHPDIASIISHIKAKGSYCAVTTNGIFVARHIEALTKVDQVQLSIDGNRDITDAQRGDGVYDALLEAVDLCAGRRIPFHLHTVITGASTPDNTLDPLWKLAERHGTWLNFCLPAKTGSAQDQNLAANGHLHEMYQAILARKQAGMPVNNSAQGLRDIIAWTAVRDCDSYIRSDDRELVKRYPKCVMGNLVCWLDSAGTLFPCAVKFGQPGFGHSIREHGIRGAWEKLRKLPCHYCPGSTEFNNLFRLNPEAVANSLKFLFRRRPGAP